MYSIYMYNVKYKKNLSKNQSFIKTSYILRTQQNYDDISQIIWRLLIKINNQLEDFV